MDHPVNQQQVDIIINAPRPKLIKDLEQADLYITKLHSIITGDLLQQKPLFNDKIYLKLLKQSNLDKLKIIYLWYQGDLLTRNLRDIEPSYQLLLKFLKENIKQNPNPDGQHRDKDFILTIYDRILFIKYTIKTYLDYFIINRLNYDDDNILLQNDLTQEIEIKPNDYA